MDTGTITLTEFLMARYDEDEAVATKATTRDEWHYEGYGDFGPFVSGAGVETEDSPQGQDIARFMEHMNPWRLLADIEAKRRIVALAHGSPEGYRALMAASLLELASVYADHPDYREEWRP